MDRFKAMQTFVKIADEGSLTAAARALASSLPATVRALAGYEKDLGVRLFNRTTRRISLTDEGRRHLDACRQVLAAVSEAEAALSADAAEPAGHLTITAPVLFGQMHVAPAVTRFVAHYPQMRCSVVLLDRVANLLEEGFDLGIRLGNLEDSSLVARHVGQIRRVIVASPAYLRRHGMPRHPRELKDANCVRVTPSPPAWGPFHDAGKSFSVPIAGKLDFNHVKPAVDACADGAGFGHFFSYQVAPLVAEKKLKIVLDKFEPAPRPINVVYPHARLLPARTRVFIDWIARELQEFRRSAS
jgi:DNA-binding transcriptional LysR family regulator